MGNYYSGKQVPFYSVPIALLTMEVVMVRQKNTRNHSTHNVAEQRVTTTAVKMSN